MGKAAPAAHHHHQAQHHHAMESPAPSLNRLAVMATLHCLTGCAIGEVTVPINRWLIACGRGHAVADARH